MTNIELFNRIRRLNIDLQHLLVLTFPKTQSSYGVYLLLNNVGVFSSKLTSHPTYSKSIKYHLDSPSKVIYFTNGKVCFKVWHNKYVQRHREMDQHALERYSDHGHLLYKEWYKDGKLHREGDVPGTIDYYENGQIKCERWCKDGMLHREGDKYTSISYHHNGNVTYTEWRKYGKLHREGGHPAIIMYQENGSLLSQSWYKDDKMYREGGLPTYVLYDEIGNMKYQE